MYYASNLPRMGAYQTSPPSARQRAKPSNAAAAAAVGETSEDLNRTLSYNSPASPNLKAPAPTDDGEMETSRSPPALLPSLHPVTSHGSSSCQPDAYLELLRNPFEFRHGRRYLRNVPYPLPVDLIEIQRQNIRTLIGCNVLGQPVCAPNIQLNVPRRVLEIGCGSGYWSALCHEYFSSLGHHDVAFTGLDIAPLAPDLRAQGVNWTFVQHDLRKKPWPFPDEDFDLVMLKDISLVLPIGPTTRRLIDEGIRVLVEGGTLEIRESDHVLRSLLPPPIASPTTSSKPPDDRDDAACIAARTATFPISPGTAFAPVRNRYLRHANKWIAAALDRRKMPPTPCARIAPILFQEPESLGSVGSRRVAIPLGQLPWEGEGASADDDDVIDSPLSAKGKARAKSTTTTTTTGTALTEDQLGLRRAALLTVVQNIESLEPLLKEASGKSAEEWGHWWAQMMASLLNDTNNSLTGECLEVGAWWATKLEGF